MTWVAISGSWRSAPPGLPDAVRREVAAALAEGKRIVAGGALGVDYWATETALGIDPARLKVILPTSLASYTAHYRRRAERRRAALIEQITKGRVPQAGPRSAT
jgi:predicted Rossmann fold nucleotide-binding protein DprA/Smf involved in DNA uptake